MGRCVLLEDLVRQFVLLFCIFWCTFDLAACNRYLAVVAMLEAMIKTSIIYWWAVLLTAICLNVKPRYVR